MESCVEGCDCSKCKKNSAMLGFLLGFPVFPWEDSPLLPPPEIKLGKYCAPIMANVGRKDKPMQPISFALPYTLGRRKDEK
jgi:hypothetical protein